MAVKTSPALLAAMLTIAASAGATFAQDAATTTPLPQAAANAVEGAATAASDAANAAADAANAATEAAANATTEAAGAAADAAGAAADAAAGAVQDAAAAVAGEAPATTEATTATETPAADGTAAAPAETAPAEGEGTEPQPGSSYTRATHGDWTMRCIHTASNTDPCELYQLMKDSNGTAVAELSLIPLEGQRGVAAGATAVAPLETDLMHGLTMQIDSGKKNAYPFAVCTPVGCVSRIGLTNEELTAMKRGNKATVTLLPFGAPEDQAVDLSLSLTGFTAGYDALAAYAAELRAGAAAAN
ncbi:MAG: invasion associated locus B family protein [Paracoccus sp. (in: a-proteobacteria)]|uniref:invasion associated locus B family protein n=1 Tax=Paracoccus sp. TaxID=267 RepID=UPI0026E06FFF|nr:invasion associated locus B family protein [Paracoccus sp. (in: a-proteobacteria)]MDO5621505.1 invasion associated locus B family protein [Paracoccus sp. (in: a-proteobacteria)]